jgi:hypothetical protein
MRKVRGKQKCVAFWVFLIAASFVLNLMLVWKTVHEHDIHNVHGDVLSPLSLAAASRNEKKMHESVLWHRMLQELHSVGCTDEKTITTTRKATYGANNSLPILGFRDDLDRFLKSDLVATQACLVPPVTSCNVKHYSIVAISNGDNLRRLFVNLMSFMTYPSVEDITVIVPNSKKELEQSVTYGRRILSWGEQGRIKLISSHSLWGAIQDIVPTSQAVIWINADNGKDWNSTSLRMNMGLWKRHSSSLIVSSAMNVDDFDSSCPTILIPQLHNLIMHRNFLCYFDHPIARSLRQYTEPLGWEMTRSALGIMLHQLGDMHISSTSTMVTVVQPTLQHAKRLKTIVKYFGCCFLGKSSVTLGDKCSL